MHRKLHDSSPCSQLRADLRFVHTFNFYSSIPIIYLRGRIGLGYVKSMGYIIMGCMGRLACCVCCGGFLKGQAGAGGDMGVSEPFFTPSNSGGGGGVKNRPYLICDSESFCAGWCQREISYSTLNYIVLYIYLYYP